MINQGPKELTAFKTKEFRSLHDEWMRKLKDAGFEEIEDLKAQDESLRKWDSHYFSARYSEEEFQNRKEYFERATKLTLSFEFTCALEKTVWICHADGLSLREIVRKLRTKTNSLNKDKAAGFIRRIRRDAWGYE